MHGFKLGEEENYGGSSNNTSSFFSIKEDGGVRRVRFMYDNADDVMGYAVHRVVVGDKERYVACLRDYNSPIDDCPLCKAGIKQDAKFYVPLYDVDTKEVCIWERGKKFGAKLAGLCSRYPHLCSHIFEIERHGAKGSKETTYEIFPTDADNTMLNDLPEVPKVIGGVVLDKSYEELNTYIRNGSFGDTKNTATTSNYNTVPTRRTPVNSNRESAF